MSIPHSEEYSSVGLPAVVGQEFAHVDRCACAMIADAFSRSLRPRTIIGLPATLDDLCGKGRHARHYTVASTKDRTPPGARADL